MRENFGGYLNYTAWKKADPKGYWAMIEGREEAMKPTINEEFGRKIASFGEPKTEWDRAIAEAISGKPVIAYRGEEVCKEIPDFIAKAYKEEEVVVEVAKKYSRLRRLWNWIKGFFKSNRQEEKVSPISQPIVPKVIVDDRDVSLNKDFDFGQWTVEMSQKIIKFIKEDGKSDGEIQCPVCFKKRVYAVMDDGIIRTNCEGCSIELVQ